MFINLFLYIGWFGGMIDFQNTPDDLRNNLHIHNVDASVISKYLVENVSFLEFINMGDNLKINLVHIPFT